MNLPTKLIFAALLFMLGSCVPSLNPLYTQKDLITDSNLNGTWIFENEKWKFELNGKNKYKLTHIYDGKKAVLDAHLLKLSNGTYLDISPMELEAENYLYQSSVIGVHTFFKVKITADQIELLMLDPDDLTEHIEMNNLQISHVISQEGKLLLTADTEELQKLVQSDLEIFSQVLVLKKGK